MELNSDWWTAVEGIDCFDKKQKKKLMSWLVDYLGSDFASYAKGHEINSIVRTLACWNPICVNTFYAEPVECTGPLFIGLDLKAYSTKEECDRADALFASMFPGLVSVCGDAVRRNVKVEGGVEYHVKHKFIDSLMGVPNGKYANAEKAIERARHLTRMYIAMTTPGLERACDFDSIDWMRPGVLKLPKSAQIEKMKNSDRLWDVRERSFADRVFNPEQNDGFIEFLRRL